MASVHSQTSNSQNVVFMPGLFNEVMCLLNDAQEYFQLCGDDDQSRIDTELRAIYTGEMARITLRLSSVMAWLMAQRAIFSGKIPAEEAERYGLDFRDACLVDNRGLQGVLPSYVCALLDRSLDLYERAMRLDDQNKQIH